MQNPAATLYCSNPSCQAPNLESQKFCQRCCTPLLKVYLWAVGEGIEAYKTGDLIAERYLVRGHRILLDTKPGLYPDTPEEIPNRLQPYLKLSAYQLHIPQVYGRVQLTTGRQNPELWLLEQAAISTGDPQVPESGVQLMPELTAVWQDTPPMRQLNWLWQIAQLWQPMSLNGVASNLLTPALLRVNGSFIRLLMLQADPKQPPTLQQLGQLWSQWAGTAHPSVANFIEQVGTQLIQGQIHNSEQLIALLDWGMETVGRSQTRTLQIVTRTDQGPSRAQNEDACYPPGSVSGEVWESGNSEAEGAKFHPIPSSTPTTVTPYPLVIVCDGIGGHEGGEVASNLAIDTIRQSIQNLAVSRNNLVGSTLALELEGFACEANDRISQLNDQEQRYDRQRMGTTLVMALANTHELYITHVGDSRAYWITRKGCYQVTLDDDVASREVRLGYALYRDAVQQNSAGSLVQALGMGSSTVLHPSVQRFILDEDSIFLLCSDGLSDNDRVEQYWESEILPVLEGQVDLETAATRLVEIANTQNGHDNVTVGLVYTQVRTGNQQSVQVSLPQGEFVSGVAASPNAPLSAPSADSRLKTQLVVPRRSGSPRLLFLLVIFFLLGLGTLFAYWFSPEVRNRVNPLIGLNPTPSPSSTAEQTPASPTSPAVVSAPTPVPSLTSGRLLQITSSITQNPEGKEVPLLLRKGFSAPQNESVIGVVAAGSVLQVVSSPTQQSADSWVQVKICSAANLKPSNPQNPVSPNPTTPSPGVVWQSPGVSTTQPALVTYRQVERGESGWIRRAEVFPVMLVDFNPTADNVGECVPTSVATPTP